ncbi:DUF5004 domain-containing protein [Gelidibacter mesophilus]|uniref:DUF5004 domain-containing protein n=1 Tax=Gelidibacter mesophilus TaxID=169050 RepID=UPI0004815A48|nr:DUF5004 domain-containing protein [Gelidibacter mesophilus]
MKKLNLITKSLMVFGALFMVSCNTDDGFTCPEPLVGELSADETAFAGTWVFVGMEADKAVDITDDNIDNPSEDIYAQYSACERDLIYDFMANRNYSLKQGSSSADCDNKDSLTGTWGLTGNTLTFVANCASQNIVIDMGAVENVFTYESTLNFRDVSGSVKPVKVTFTYERMVEAQPE